jgi:octaprenyl-diphosphate synthase
VTEAMARFGRYVGQAFQIADDLLDLVGEETLAGKSLGTDLEQGKMTLPLIHLLATGAPEQAARARQVLLGEHDNRREALRPLLHEAGSLGYARRRAVELTRRALEELAAQPPSPCRSVLEAMTERVVHRES